MAYTVHHVHNNGHTVSVIPKPIMAASEFLRVEGHTGCCEIARYSKGKFHFFLCYSADSLGLGEQYAN